MNARTVIRGDRESQSRAIHILLVEDNPGDVRLIEEGLASAPVATEVHVARDGAKAMAYLEQEGEFREASRPDLILLDLNLPGLNGYDVLQNVKEDAQLKQIPVVIMTTSDNEEDLHKSYRLQAAGFVTKPIDARTFISTVKDLGLYWAAVVQLPNSQGG